MIIIACVDDNNGLAFNQRRQSQDRCVRERIKERLAHRLLYVDAYTALQFEETWQEKLIVTDKPFEEVGKGDVCWLERGPMPTHLDQVEEIWLYHWNRVYPADTYYTIDMSGWHCKERQDFPGYSHEMITEEIYER